MSRALLASAALHALAVLAAMLLGLVGGARRTPLPPVYQVQLVSAAELAPQRSRPEPRPEPPVEEEKPPEPEPVEELPEPERPAPRRPERTPEPAARPGPEAARRTGPELPITLEGRPFEFPWYLEEIYRKVARNWRPPSATLKVTIHFRIDKSGRIEDIEVERSSGNFLFDQAALRAVQAAHPMPPLPREYSGDWLGVYFDFDTQVRPSQ